MLSKKKRFDKKNVIIRTLKNFFENAVRMQLFQFELCVT